MTSAERKRESRQRKLARGECLDCPAPADYGVRCFACAVAHANALPWLLKMMLILSENKCPQCGGAKERFTTINCAKCRKIQRLAA